MKPTLNKLTLSNKKVSELYWSPREAERVLTLGGGVRVIGLLEPGRDLVVDPSLGGLSRGPPVPGEPVLP